MISARRYVYALLVGCFVVQTTLIYLDDSGYQTRRLSPTAQAGRKIWRENNCQSCHQLYGFGGFLGPDLTNAINNLADERMQTILTVGASPMPAFHFTSDEIGAISSFLSEVDATGTGQFRFVATPAADEILDRLVEEIGAQHPLSEPMDAGYRVVRKRKCIGCHLPNLLSDKKAPDLCEVIVSPGEGGIISTIENGRVSRGMPQFEMTAEELKSVLAFLNWMHDHRTEIRSVFRAISIQNAGSARIPWFEYGE